MSTAKLAPFKLSDVPASMSRFVLENERKRGSISCPSSVYLLVLALRAVLSYEREDWQGARVETRRVFWQFRDEAGSGINIWLYEPRLTDHDTSDALNWSEAVVVQNERWTLLADISYRSDRGVTHVSLPNSAAYPDSCWLELPAEAGLWRIIEDAAYGSKATHRRHPLEDHDEYALVNRTHDNTYVRIEPILHGDGGVVGIQASLEAYGAGR